MKSISERLADKIKKRGACWIWIGTKHKGYGKINVGNRRIKWAHRVAYELKNGTIPKGLHVDHLCRNRACINPKHLEAVSQHENNVRCWNVHRKTHCPQGHKFTKNNIYKTVNGRVCRTCRIKRSNEYYHRKK